MARPMSLVTMPAESPNRVASATWRASSNECTRRTASTGPNTSWVASSDAGSTPVKTVGRT